MPRSRSSGALSIWSNGVKSARPLSAWRLVMAAVSVVLPWSMCPIVPMFTWGLVRSNFCFAIWSSSFGVRDPTVLIGSGGWNRTTDTAIMSRLLYL